MKTLRIVVSIGLFAMIGWMTAGTALALGAPLSDRQTSELLVMFGDPQEFDSAGTPFVELDERVSAPQAPRELLGELASEPSFQAAPDPASLAGAPVAPATDSLRRPAADDQSRSSTEHPLPEPSTLFLVGLGVLGLAALGTRKRA